MIPRSWIVLLIEDLPIYIAVIKNLLQGSKITLDTAQSLSEGVEKAQSTSYDAVLLDLGLPDSRGLDTFIAFNAACSSTPTIILSGLDDEDVAIQALQNGAQDYLVKGSYLVNDKGGKLLLNRSIAYAIERHQIQIELLEERNSLEHRVAARTKELREANVHLQTLASSLVSAQEDERKRIAMELHDEAGQFMTALKLSLNMIQNELENASTPLIHQVQEANQLTDAIITKLRTLARDLRPPAIDAVGLAQVLQDHCRKISRQSGIEIHFQGSSTNNLPGHIKMTLYRIVQEALTNIVKHAGAKRTEVLLESDAEQILLSIKDDGCGFTIPEPSSAISKSGIGLLLIKDRTEAVGGKFTINSKPGEGTLLLISIPLKDFS